MQVTPVHVEAVSADRTISVDRMMTELALSGLCLRQRGGRKTPAASSGLQRLAQIDCRDLESFAIFCNRTARDHEPLFRQQFGYSAVR